ncbi:MAG: NAD-dependent epimerase/dehydratase family protein [Pseudomonadota bacterium]
MHVLLTGVTGFIAHRIAHDLLTAGHHVRGSLRDMGRADDVRSSMPTDATDRLDFVELTLDDDTGWAAAAQGMDAVVHTASPFPIAQIVPDPQTVIRPAVDGTLRALRAARDAAVKRVVLTSSTVAITNGPRPENRKRDERDWSTPDHPNANAYVRSKTEAERAAWDFAKEHGLDLTSINPGFVLGPPLGAERNTSLKVVERLMSGKDPMVPPIAFETVDVRDVSRAHVSALTAPDSIGERFALVAGTLWFSDIADIAADLLPGRKIPKRTAPRLLIRALSLFDPALKGIVPILGRNDPVSGDKAARTFGIDWISPRDAARASVEALA